MSWPILIGVSTSGELLIGSRAVQTAEHRGELADSERIWPSQMEHRCALHWTRTLCENGQPSDCWTIGKPRWTQKHYANCHVDEVKNFPKADRDKSTRKTRGEKHGKQE